MLKNYFKVAFRSLNKNRVYAFINILGLALGLTVTLLVFMFVKDETSYDKHWSGADRIYRTGIKADMMGQKMDAPVSPSPMANTLRTEFTDVETATRFQNVRQEILVRHEQNKIYIQKGVYADSLFFSVFDYEFVHGNPETALNEPNAMVLTEESATKLFGDANPMGGVVNYDNRRDYIVKGVVKHGDQVVVQAKNAEVVFVGGLDGVFNIFNRLVGYNTGASANRVYLLIYNAGVDPQHKQAFHINPEIFSVPIFFVNIQSVVALPVVAIVVAGDSVKISAFQRVDKPFGNLVVAFGLFRLAFLNKIPGANNYIGILRVNKPGGFIHCFRVGFAVAVQVCNVYKLNGLHCLLLLRIAGCE